MDTEELVREWKERNKAELIQCEPLHCTMLLSRCHDRQERFRKFYYSGKFDSLWNEDTADITPWFASCQKCDHFDPEPNERDRKRQRRISQGMKQDVKHISLVSNARTFTRLTNPYHREGGPWGGGSKPPEDPKTAWRKKLSAGSKWAL